jgi:hypothetical protein
MYFRRFLLIFAAVVWDTTYPMWAQGTITPISITRDYVFPPVGLGSTETASITVVNTATVLSDGTSSAPSCTGTISFSNANGAIGTLTSFMVGSEQFKTVTLPFASAGLTGNRGEIHGKVSVIVSTSPSTPCSLMFSLETYDSTEGATHLVLSNSLANVVEPFPPIVVPGNR